MDDSNYDIAALIELLKMAGERWPRVEHRKLSASEHIRQDRSILEMWPEACRRTGVGKREFPLGVIQLWQQGLGKAN